MIAGNYPTRFEWYAHSYGTADGFGEKPDVWAAVAHLWGGYDGEASTGPEEWRGATAERVRQTIRVRNYPDVSPLDSLVDPLTGDDWRVEGVVWGTNETVLTVFRHV